MESPCVSIIVAAFDAEETLGDCLASLGAQTTNAAEILVVDDGSTDRTAAIASAFAAESSLEVRVITQPNKGRAAARNTALREALGEYVGFVDADDFVEPEMYERLLACAQRSGADVVVCEYVSFDAATGQTINHYEEGSSRWYGASVRENPSLLTTLGASVCNKLFRRSLFTHGGIEFPPGRDFEDLATVYRLVLSAHRIEKVSEVLYHYRQGHHSSIMSACDARYMQIIDALAVSNDHFISEKAFDEFRDQLESINVTHLLAGRLNDFLPAACAADRAAFIRRAFIHLERYFPGWKGRVRLDESRGRRVKRLVITSAPLLNLYARLVGRTRR